MPSNNSLEKAVNLGQLQMAYEAGALLPVDISTITPASTFQKNAVVGINGVLYRATGATQNLPCTLTVQDCRFVVNIVNGKTSFTVTDPAPNEGWEVFTDASIEFWISQLNARITALEGETYTANGQQYTRQQLLQAVAELMSRTVVINA